MIDQIKVISHRKIKLEELSEFKSSDNFKKLDGLDFIDWFTDEHYKTIELLVIDSNEIFIMYHGFPGENPFGFAYNSSNKDDYVYLGVNNSNNNSNNKLTENSLKILDWYNKLTENNSLYEGDLWVLFPGSTFPTS